MKILFVCTGNTCRSPMAELIAKKFLKDKNISVSSAGILTADGLKISLNSKAALEEIGIFSDDFRSTSINKEMIEESDLVITMTNQHKKQIMKAYDLKERIYTLKEFSGNKDGDIEDPYGMSLEEYRKCRDKLQVLISKVIEKILFIGRISNMRIGIGSDHGGYELKEKIKDYLKEKNIEIVDYGTNSLKSVDYPEYAKKTAEGVISKECDRAILICGTGIGISIAANKVKGIRCALCSDTYSAKMSREHNDSNILALGARVLGEDLAKEIVKSWLNAEFLGGRHERRVEKIMEIEK